MTTDNKGQEMQPELNEEEAIAEVSSLAAPALISGIYAGEEHLHQTLRTPTASVSVSFRTVFVIANIVIGLCSVTIKQLLLPTQVAFLDPSNKFTSLALVASVGALAGVIISPLAGALSDRTTFRFGRRRVWLAGGVILAVCALVLMAQAPTIYWLLLGEVFAQIAIDTIWAALEAVLPDRIPPRQRATPAALAGMAPIFGGAVGLVLVTRFTSTYQQGYYLLAALSLVIIISFVLLYKEEALPKGVLPPFRLKTFLAELVVNPRTSQDFFLVWLSRCFIFLCWTLLVSYLLYFTEDVLHYNPRLAGQNVATFQIIVSLCVLVSAFVGGKYAARLQRLKPFVIFSAIVMAIALALVAFAHTWPTMLLAAVILGIGLGVYLGVDLALAVSVLPTARSRAKDLGFLNTAVFLPLVFTPIIGAFVLNLSHNYTLLYCIAAACALIGSCLILPIKQVR